MCVQSTLFVEQTGGSERPQREDDNHQPALHVEHAWASGDVALDDKALEAA